MKTKNISKNIKKMNKGLLIPADCLNVLKDMPTNVIDLIVTDPPYGLKFMGKDWDKALPDTEIFKECLRVLKPGAFAYVMAAPRQDALSRMMVKLEDAGFKIDYTSIYWTYATGFPKASNTSKKIDKGLGKEREVIGTRKQHDIRNNGYSSKKSEFIEEIKGGPVSDEAKRFEGSYGGFQPKPAVEVIIVVQKPGTQGAQYKQALNNGKGVTWLDDCRTPYGDEKVQTKWNNRGNNTINASENVGTEPITGENAYDPTKGRFPANLLVSDNVLGKKYSKFFSFDEWKPPFIIIPKASKKEKDAGCESLDEHKIVSMATCNGTSGKPSSITKRRNTRRRNNHPTVKPIKLMSYLITMGSREGDIVLDPFCGSGTTGVAAMMMDRKFICIEKDPEFHKIANARLKGFSDAVKRYEKSEAKPVRALSEIESITLRCDDSVIDMQAVSSAIDHALNNPVAKSDHKGVQIETTFTKSKPAKPEKEKDNVQDWADKGINISKGCSNNCLYCYAREESVRRHGNTNENWPNEQLNEKMIKKGWRKSSKRLMFPSTHDITPGTYDVCESTLKKLLEAGNPVLIVSKPRPELIERLCDSLEPYKKLIMFRFTISARNNDILSFWEPNAPDYEDRLKALKIAYANGFRTSVSIEPMLDPADIKGLVEDLRDFTTDCMWIGPVKMIRKRVRIDSDEIEQEIQKIEAGQTPEKLLKVYELYKDDPLIKWKGHFRKLMRKVDVEVPEQHDDWRDKL